MGAEKAQASCLFGKVQDFKTARKEMLKNEQQWPGITCLEIKDKLSVDGKQTLYDFFLGIQTSSIAFHSTRDDPSPYIREYTWDISDLSPGYDRESSKFYNSYLGSFSNQSNLDTDKEKIKRIMCNIKYDEHIDNQPDIYQVISENYKEISEKYHHLFLDKKTDFIENNGTIDGNFLVSSDDIKSVLEKIDDQKENHIVFETIGRSLREIYDNYYDSKIKNDNYSIKYFKAMVNTAGVISAFDLDQEIREKKTIENKQTVYDEFLSLYELYNHLLYSMLYYHSESGNPFYSLQDYQKNTKGYGNIFKDVEDISCVHIPARSGMDAMTKVMTSFLTEKDRIDSMEEAFFSPKKISLCKNIVNENVEDIYYEINNLDRYFSDRMECPTFITGLSSSRYSINGDYRSKYFVSEVRVLSDKNPSLVILDVTMPIPYQHKDPYADILKDLSGDIQSGRVIVANIKSHQKFETLGTQKARSGNIELIFSRKSYEENERYNKYIEKVKFFGKLFSKEELQSNLQFISHLHAIGGEDIEKKIVSQIDHRIQKIEDPNIIPSLGMMFYKGQEDCSFVNISFEKKNII